MKKLQSEQVQNWDWFSSIFCEMNMLYAVPWELELNRATL